MILSRLLGLTFRQEKPGPGELWHDSVQKFTLRDGERALGILYLDPFMRPGKVIQSAQFTLQGVTLRAPARGQRRLERLARPPTPHGGAEV